MQGPDGDELSINGQKGIQNNVSVDGADFNNPFFGEQRGGQRPPVHVQPRRRQGSRRRRGRRERRVRPRLGRVRERRDEVRHERHPRERARLLQEPEPLVGAREPGRQLGAEDRLQPAAVRLHAGRALRQGQALLLHGVRLPEGNLDEADGPEPHRPGSRPVLRLGRGAGRERPDRPDERRPRLPREDRLGDQRAAPRDGPVQLHVVRAEERDVRRRPVGRQRERGRGRPLERRERLAPVDPLELDAERVPLPVGARGPAPAVRRPAGPRTAAAPSRTPASASRATASACRSSCRSTTTTRACSSTRSSRTSRAITRSRRVSSTTRPTRRRRSAASRTAGTSSTRSRAS